jgi:hypothetical protein
VASKSDTTITQQMPKGGTTTKRARRIDPGTVVDIPQGMKYHAGPLGSSETSSHIEAEQAGLRRVGKRWNLPEYMISGDASNANYSSTLVAESPFIKSQDTRQQFYAMQWKKLFWKVIALALGARGIDVRQVKQLVELAVDPPDIAVRNKKEEHDLRKSQYDAGFLSLATWATEEGRDLEEEQVKGAQSAADREIERQKTMAQATGQPPGFESVREDCGSGDGGFKAGNTCATGGRAAPKVSKGPRGSKKTLTPKTKSEIAKSAHVMVDKTIQRYSEDVNEPYLAKRLGGKSMDDNEPHDVYLEIGDKRHGIELKTMVSNTNDKLTMKRSAMDRKRAWERKNKATMHTVVFDDREVFNAKGDGKHD